MDKNTFIFMAAAMGSNKDAATLGMEWDALNAQLNPAPPAAPVPPEQQPGIADLVNAWLENLKKGTQQDRDTFEAIRKGSYPLQYAEWNLAGRPGEVI